MRSAFSAILLGAASLLAVGAASYLSSAGVIGSLGGSVTAAYSDGPALFEAYCKSCHTTRAVPGGAIGPNLTNIGRDASSRKPGSTATQYILESILEPAAVVAPGAQAEMPNLGGVLTSSQIKSLVFFLANQGASLNRREVDRLRVRRGTADEATVDSVRVMEDIVNGADLFFGKAECSRCHSVLPLDEASRLLGPGLWGVGTQSPAMLRESILSPSAKIVSAKEEVRVATVDGAEHTGILVSLGPNETTIAIETGDGSGRLVSFPADEIATTNGSPAVTPTGRSSMPADYGTRLTASEIDDLVSYLRTLY